MRFRATNWIFYAETLREIAVPVARGLASGGPSPPFEEQPDSRPQLLPAMDFLHLKALDRARADSVKHIGAKEAEVELTGGPHTIELRILDRGVRFDPKTTNGKGLDLTGHLKLAPASHTWFRRREFVS